MRSYRLLFLSTMLLLMMLAPASGHFSDCAEQLLPQLAVEFDTGTLYDPPAGYSKFVYSNNYPTSLSAVQPQTELPWEFFDFQTEPEAYLKAIMDYCFAGNILPDGSFDFNMSDNTGQRWYHAPWLHTGVSGREPISGLTAEHAAQPGYLGPEQKRIVQNWAVGYYNELGAVTFGDVWRNRAVPQLTRCIFPSGTATFKLLFTEATSLEVPQLTGTFTIPAMIHERNPDGTVDKNRRVSSPVTMHLIQIDVAVKDSRSTETGWVFGTLAYDGFAEGKTWRDRLVPIGLAWGNDPGYVADPGAGPGECWINQPAGDKWLNGQRTQLGHQGRLNGPLDNQASSCMSCHSTAQYPPAPLAFADRDKLDAAGARAYSPTYSKQHEDFWFRNLPAGKPFRAGDMTADYSLQLSKGVAAYNTWLSNNCKQSASEQLDVDDSVARQSDESAAAAAAECPVQPAH